ncbi:hypothetical protein J2S14_003279 [Lederbergia wuyishanensis]|uniref:Uncharacterized protein n=1 Tax=Lederbergia wuyishanensis TaxID=1347903 RepID=A0ABU0D7P7_9BACI|nr:hypothetical protein [Lederbergia wuyishanensis]
MRIQILQSNKKFTKKNAEKNRRTNYLTIAYINQGIRKLYIELSLYKKNKSCFIKALPK